MKIDTENLISITEANQNFSKVVKKVDSDGQVIILKNNQPRYLVSKIDDLQIKLTDNELMEVVAKRILSEHKHAFEVLAKWLNLIKKKYCYYNN